MSDVGMIMNKKTSVQQRRDTLLHMAAQDEPVSASTFAEALRAFEYAVRHEEDHMRRESSRTGSAWAEIVSADGSDEWLARCSAALEEVQTQQRRRDARKIYADVDENQTWADAAVEMGKKMAGRLIDPDVE